VTRRMNESDDRVSGGGVELTDASLLDFWRWAFSDLCDDDVKGIFAEWLVVKLMGIPQVRRVSWANSDLITPEGSGPMERNGFVAMGVLCLHADGTRDVCWGFRDAAAVAIEAGPRTLGSRVGAACAGSHCESCDTTGERSLSRGLRG
jgi:hypothetical protein